MGRSSADQADIKVTELRGLAGQDQGLARPSLQAICLET